MYTWTRDESITAAKLNATGRWGVMQAIGNNPVTGGITSDILECMLGCYDPGSAPPQVRNVDQVTHALGAGQLEYNDTCEAWQVRTGTNGVTGYKRISGGSLNWLAGVPTTGATRQLWQQITTDTYGNPTAVQQQLLSTAPAASQLWRPDAQGGTIWRHMADVRWDASRASYDVTNTNDTVILPVARHYGWLNTSTLEVNQDCDLSNRLPNAHIVPVAKPDPIGNTVPVLGAMEVGGVRVDEVTCGGTPIGLGLSSGIEWYDDNTLPNLNTTDPRPQPTSASVKLWGRTLTVQPAGNHGRGWQWHLTTDDGAFDPGSCGWGDPGSYAYANYRTAAPDRSGIVRGIATYSCCAAPWIDNGVLHIYSPI